MSDEGLRHLIAAAPFFTRAMVDAIESVLEEVLDRLGQIVGMTRGAKFVRDYSELLGSRKQLFDDFINELLVFLGPASHHPAGADDDTLRQGLGDQLSSVLRLPVDT